MILLSTRVSGKYAEAGISIGDLFTLLTSDETDVFEYAPNKDKVQHIIAWLPSIKSIDIAYFCDNNRLTITFLSGDEVVIYNTGYEGALYSFISNF